MSGNILSFFAASAAAAFECCSSSGSGSGGEGKYLVIKVRDAAKIEGNDLREREKQGEFR